MLRVHFMRASTHDLADWHPFMFHFRFLVSSRCAGLIGCRLIVVAVHELVAFLNNLTVAILAVLFC